MMYPEYVISINLFILYIMILLNIRTRIEMTPNRRVVIKVTELPSPNHAVSENGM